MMLTDHQSPAYLRILLICVVLVTSCWLAPAKAWEIVKVKNIEYVTAAEIAQFYSIDRFEKRGRNRTFRHPSMLMEWDIGTQAIYINRIKFNLSLPIAESDGRALISTIDLAKLIDPVFRPSYIRKSIEFDTVVIDPGHGGIDTGAKGRQGLEKDYNLDLSLKLKAELEKRGLKTVMTRADDRGISLTDRVAIANAHEKAIFISIHFNSSGSRSASGVETYALPPMGTAATHKSARTAKSSALHGNAQDAENIALATAVHSHVIHTLSPIDRGIKRGTLYVLQGINIPAILYEGGFLTNATEAKKIHDPAYRQRAAKTIAVAIEKFQRVVSN